MFRKIFDSGQPLAYADCAAHDSSRRAASKQAGLLALTEKKGASRAVHLTVVD